MITIVIATNRKNALSAKIANIYKAILAQKGTDAHIFSLENLPADFLNTVLYQKEKPEAFLPIQKMVNETQKFVFIIPEYNGSYPGVLKTFVDALSFPGSFKGKKGAMVGISSGTQGAAMAMSHFGDILNYLGMHTLALRPRLIQINKFFEGDALTNAEYQQFLEIHAQDVLDF